jgi:predicted secreted hydrolase
MATRVEPGLYQLKGAAGDYSFNLFLADIKGLVHHGGNGTIRMTTYTTDSFYYSRPRMQITGTLTKDGEPLDVSGQAWMDHQWGNWMPLGMIGWDWFSLRLDDGTEVMYFIFRGDREDQSVIDNALGSYTDQNNDLILLSIDEVTVTPLDWWESEKTGGVYPQNWRMEIPGLDMDVTLTTDLADQEMPNPIWNYWEGLLHVEGTKEGQPVTGKAFVELSGYAGRSFFWRD